MKQNGKNNKNQKDINDLNDQERSNSSKLLEKNDNLQNINENFAVPKRLMNKGPMRSDSHKVEPNTDKNAGKRFSAMLIPDQLNKIRYKPSNPVSKEGSIRGIDYPKISINQLSRLSSLQSGNYQMSNDNYQSWASESMIPDVENISIRTLEETKTKKTKSFIKISNTMDLVNFESLLDTAYINAVIDL